MIIQLSNGHQAIDTLTEDYFDPYYGSGVTPSDEEWAQYEADCLAVRSHNDNLAYTRCVALNWDKTVIRQTYGADSWEYQTAIEHYPIPTLTTGQESSMMEWCD